MSIRVLCIDIDQTLLDFEACAHQCIRQGFEDWNLVWNPKDFGVFLEVNDALWAKLEAGTMDLETFNKTRFPEVFSRANIDADGEAFEKVFRDLLFESHVPVDGALAALEHLHGQFPLFVVSNGDQAQQENRLKRAGMSEFFEEILTSEKMGAKKPDPRFFENALIRMRKTIPDLQPDEVLIIGDSLRSDIQGGKKAGWNTWHFGPDHGWDLLQSFLFSGNDPSAFSEI